MANRKRSSAQCRDHGLKFDDPVQIMQPLCSMLRLIVFVLSLAMFAGRAQSEDQITRFLSLSDCIQMALRHNYDVQIERYSPEITRYNLEGSYGAYEPFFNFSAGEQFLNQPGGVDLKKSGVDFPYELTTDSFGMGVTGLLPTGLSYGAQANANYLGARTDFNLVPGTAAGFPPDGIRLTNQYVSVAAITLRQPLLKDFWIDPYRQKIWVNEKNLNISEMVLRWKIMNTVNAVQQAYYETMFARESVRVEERSLELANQLLNQTRRRVEVGDLPPLDEKQAEAQVQTVQTDLFAAEQALAERQNALKNLVTDDFPAWADVNLEPNERLTAVFQFFNRSESWQNAIRTRPDLAQSRLESEKLGIIVRYNFNQRFPSLDLVGGYGLQGVENSFEGTLADIRGRTNPHYSYGVEVSIPLGGNRAARNAYKTSQAARKQAELRLKKMEQDILVQVDDSIKLAQSTYKRTSSSREARLYAEAALEAEEKKLQNGTSTPFVVLQLQQKLTDAQTAEIRALADYNKALAQLALSEGSTLEKNRLAVDVK
jgi:outer membrane protein TolC